MNANSLVAPIVEQLGWVLVHSIWQFAFLALAAFVIAKAMASASAAARYVVLSSAMLLMVASPVLTWCVLLAGPDAAGTRDVRTTAVDPAVSPTDAEPMESPLEPPRGVADAVAVDERPAPSPGLSSGIAAEPPEPRTSWKLRWAERFEPRLSTIVGAWCIGVLLFSSRPMFGWYTVRRLRRVGVTDAGNAVALAARRIAESLRVRQAVQVLQSTLVQTPVVVGYFRPAILLPASILTGLPVAQLEAILAHELAHVSRHDYLVNLLQTLVETAFFYHPAVWSVSRWIRIEREHCCDDLVVTSLGNRVEYGRALLAIAEFRGTATALILGARSGPLLGRIRRLFDLAPAQRTTPVGGLIGLGLLTLAIVVAGLWLKAHGDQQAALSDSADEPAVQDSGPSLDDLTPAQVAERIEATMRQFASVEYTATFRETRDARAFNGKVPLPVSGDGSLRYLSDGERWLADETGFTLVLGQPGAIPTHTVSGFDGDQHFIANDTRLALGEHEFANGRLAPRAILWHGGVSDGRLTSALRSSNARIDRREMIGGRECIVVVSEPGRPKPEDSVPAGNQLPEWRFEMVLSPSQSWLPLTTEVQRDGKPYAVETLEELAQTPDGAWYPRTIRFRQHGSPTTKEKETRITSFRLRDKFDPAEFRFASPLPLGYDIVDHRRGRVWHNDPWWPDLAPWLAKNMAWPRPNLSSLADLKSYADKKIHGQPAPPIQAAQWFNGDPGRWDRVGRKLTILFFLGGDAVQPTPQWIAGLKSLYERYGKDGLDVVCVTPSAADPVLVRRTVKSLDIRFPVAIDAEGSEKKSWGSTYEAFGMSTYAGTFLIESAGRVVFLDPSEQPPTAQVSLLESLIRKQLALSASAQAALDLQPALTREELEQVAAEWKRLRREYRTEREGEERLWALLRFPGGIPPADGQIAKLEIVPELRLLNTNTPGGWTLLYDNAWPISSDEGCDIFGLPKGTYRLTVTRPGFAAVQRRLTLPVASPGKSLEILMMPGDSIRGQVVDSAGQAISGATIKATKRHIDPTTPRRYTTEHLPHDPRSSDARGEFVFEPLFEGWYTLEIAADGYQKVTIDPVPVGKRDVSITLRKTDEAASTKSVGAKLAEATEDATNAGAASVAAGNTPAEPLAYEARVLDAATGEPVPTFRVLAGVPFKGVKDEATTWQPHTIRQFEAGRLAWEMKRAYDVMKLRIEADGYQTMTTEWLKKADERKPLELRLERDPGIELTFVTPDGQPARGAVVALGMSNRSVRLKGRTIEDADQPRPEKLSDQWRRADLGRTDNEGKVRLPTERDSTAILCVVHESGYFDRPFAAYLEVGGKPLASRTIALQSWGQIDGQVLWKGQPGAKEIVQLSVSRDASDYPVIESWSASIPCDEQGKFRVDDLPPGRVQLFHISPAGADAKNRYFHAHVHPTVKPGEPTRVIIGGHGRVVRGRLKGLDRYAGITVRIAPNTPRPGDREMMAAWSAFSQTQLGKLYFRDAVAVGEDGTFHIDDVLPAHYQLFVRNQDHSVHRVQSLHVAGESADDAPEPLDVGEIALGKAKE